MTSIRPLVLSLPFAIVLACSSPSPVERLSTSASELTTDDLKKCGFPVGACGAPFESKSDPPDLKDLKCSEFKCYDVNKIVPDKTDPKKFTIPATAYVECKATLPFCFGLGEDIVASDEAKKGKCNAWAGPSANGAGLPKEPKPGCSNLGVWNCIRAGGLGNGNILYVTDPNSATVTPTRAATCSEIGAIFGSGANPAGPGKPDPTDTKKFHWKKGSELKCKGVKMTAALTPTTPGSVLGTATSESAAVYELAGSSAFGDGDCAEFEEVPTCTGEEVDCSVVDCSTVSDECAP
ncbi:MAG: hypothetical protein JNL79_38880 [Myxococcales bacterium]|nr:hypothetical protein [Myxococcales bacterium]